MKVSELFEARAPFKKGDRVITKNAQKLRGVVSSVNKNYEFVVVNTDDGHEFNADFNQVELDTGKKPAAKLSARDREIKELLANGQSPEEVAAIMKLSVNKILDIQQIEEAKSFAEKQSKGPLKWWVVTGKDGEPCGRIDARTRDEAQQKAEGHWFGKGVTVKQQKPELINGKVD